MFLGSVPNSMLKVVGSIVKEWSSERIYVGCSGNFTIERAISNLVDAKITSNDVTIYSSYIGKYLAGESIDELRIKEDYDGDCEFLKDYMGTDVQKIATLILASDILQYDKQQHRFARRNLEAYRSQYKRIHDALITKLEQLKTKVDTFYHGDVMDMLDEIDEQDAFISFPPFFKGGYEKMWESLNSVFDYEEPYYEMFDPEIHIEEFCKKVKRLSNFIVGAEREVKELEEYFSGVVTTLKGKSIYIYSRSEKVHFVNSTSRATKAKPIMRIGPNDKISENIEIRKITIDQFYEIRALYLGLTVKKVAAPSASFGLFSDNKLFGVFALSNSQMLTGSDKLEKPTVYLLTDFAIKPSCEKNLSKLVLYCILSKEAKLLAEKVMKKRVNSITTNAFSKNPVSMKYRGLFELYSRKELEKDESGKVSLYNLSYGTRMGEWTIKEGYEKWRRK